MTTWRATAMVLAGALLAGPPARGGVVELTNGFVVEGRIVERLEDGSLRLEIVSGSGHGAVVIPAAQIAVFRPEAGDVLERGAVSPGGISAGPEDLPPIHITEVTPSDGRWTAGTVSPENGVEAATSNSAQLGSVVELTGGECRLAGPAGWSHHPVEVPGALAAMAWEGPEGVTRGGVRTTRRVSLVVLETPPLDMEVQVDLFRGALESAGLVPESPNRRTEFVGGQPLPVYRVQAVQRAEAVPGGGPVAQRSRHVLVRGPERTYLLSFLCGGEEFEAQQPLFDACWESFRIQP
ncbi:MAG: hypothetical protein HY722_02395 [Planctomycetes bacterium]|nr:hypothetical protein [Planctomycetota bacterium]